MVCVHSECSQSGASVVTTRVKLAARSKEEDGAWLDTDGCNTCLCGPLGAVCTE